MAETLSALDQLAAKKGRVPNAPDVEPDALSQASSTRPAFVTGMSTVPLIKLPYPAAVYRAGAERVDLDGIVVCITDGPHIAGAGCREIKVADLLRGVADAIDGGQP